MTVAEPWTVPTVAVAVADPAASADPVPAATVSTLGLEVDHEAVDVTSCVVPSLKVAVAVNAIESPTVGLGFDAETATETGREAFAG